MKKANIKSIMRGKFRPQPNAEIVVERPDILEQNFTTTSINEKWVADIRISTISEGWCYLASVFYLQSKKIVGHSFSRTMTVELIVQALDNALVSQEPPKGIVLLNEKRTQYGEEMLSVRQHLNRIIPCHSEKDEIRHVNFIDYS